ncbi:hypothetical protein EES39_32145 [Streptomyces sp. ADI92-24]|nr:hypothetical protein EES39_32145 [Streptomyces sp. ADI92-24]
MVPASRVNSLVTEVTGRTSSSRRTTPAAARSYASWPSSSGARNSTSSAAVSFGSPAQSAGTPWTLTEARRVFPSISSTAMAPASLNSGTAAAAAVRDGKKSSAVETRRSSGSVSKTTSEMKPKVPSEPTMSPRRISTGVVPSRKASSRYPLVFLISYLARIRAVSPASASISAFSARSPAQSCGSACARSSSAEGSPVSTTVPPGSTKVSDETVRYELRLVPAVIPEALLATTPPIVQAIALAGSGPSSRPCRARVALARMIVVPGRMRARAPPSRTSMPAQWCRTSTRMSSPCAWPFRLVPAARKTMLRPLPCAYDRIAETSSMSSGTTTTWGTNR